MPTTSQYSEWAKLGKIAKKEKEAAETEWSKQFRPKVIEVKTVPEYSKPITVLESRPAYNLSNTHFIRPTKRSYMLCSV